MKGKVSASVSDDIYITTRNEGNPILLHHMFWHAAAAAKSLQLCPTLCDPIDGSPPGSTVPGILQTRALEWVAISFSKAWKWKVKSESEVALSCPTLSNPPWTAAYQVPLSMGFSRQEYWSGLPLLSLVLTWTSHKSLNLRRIFKILVN